MPKGGLVRFQRFRLMRTSARAVGFRPMAETPPPSVVNFKFGHRVLSKKFSF